LLDRLNPTIAELSQAIEQEAEKRPAAQRLMTHPGVGALTALAFVLIIGDAQRFQCGKQVASYLGLVPLEDSSGNRRRLGHITKQGSSMLRFLLVEAAQVAVHSLPEWPGKYMHLMIQRGRKTAKIAMVRRLAVRLYWMMRQGWDYQQWIEFGSHAGQPGTGHGVPSNIESRKSRMGLLTGNKTAIPGVSVIIRLLSSRIRLARAWRCCLLLGKANVPTWDGRRYGQ